MKLDFGFLVRLPACLKNWLWIEFGRHACIQQAGKEDPMVRPCRGYKITLVNLV